MVIYSLYIIQKTRSDRFNNQEVGEKREVKLGSVATGSTYERQLHIVVFNDLSDKSCSLINKLFS